MDARASKKKLLLFGNLPLSKDVIEALERIPFATNRKGFPRGCRIGFKLATGRRPARMGRPYSEDLRSRIVAAVEANGSRRGVCGKRKPRHQAGAAIPTGRIGSTASPREETLCFS